MPPQIGASLPQPVQLSGAPGTLIADGSASTRTINGTYLCGTVAVAGSASALVIASITNPAASGRRVFITTTKLNVAAGAAAVGGLIQAGRASDTPSSGTVETIQLTATGSAAPVAVVRSGPTATAAAGRMGSIVTGILSGGQTTAKTIYDADISRAIQLAEGESLLVFSAVSSLNQTFTVEFGWIEAT